MSNPETIAVIDAIGARGEGLARVEDHNVFIPLTLPGETVRVAVDGDRATLFGIVKSSPDRVPAFCPHFGSCGGCQLQHWSRSAYEAWKRERVVAALQRSGIETEIMPLINAEGDGRRRATLHAREGGAGFMPPRSHKVHDLDSCPVLVSALKPAADIARACYGALGDCDVAFTATPVGLDVAVRAGRKWSDAKLTALAQKFRLARLAVNGETVFMNVQPQIMMGAARVNLPVGAFLQATGKAEEVLAAEVGEAVAGAARIADLFCGLGPFALRLARNAKVFAVDSDAGALAACDAALRGTPGLKVIGTSTRDLFRDPLTIDELKKFDAVVLDPPRAGAEAQVRMLARSKVAVVASVSCDPGTFARDAAILVAGGYRLERCVPVDQFVWSSHVEIVGIFRR